MISIFAPFPFAWLFTKMLEDDYTLRKKKRKARRQMEKSKKFRKQAVNAKERMVRQIEKTEKTMKTYEAYEDYFKYKNSPEFNIKVEHLNLLELLEQEEI